MGKTTNLNWWVDPGFLNHQQYQSQTGSAAQTWAFPFVVCEGFNFWGPIKWNLDISISIQSGATIFWLSFHAFMRFFSLRMNFYEFLFDLLNVLRNLIFRASTLSWSSPTKTESWPLLWKHQSLLNNHPGKPLKQGIFDMPRILRVALVGILKTYTRIAFGPENILHRS